MGGSSLHEELLGFPIMVILSSLSIMTSWIAGGRVFRRMQAREGRKKNEPRARAELLVASQTLMFRP